VPADKLFYTADDPSAASASVLPFPVPRVRHRRGRCGLRNLGNTCYMNSVIQALSHTSVLTERLARVHALAVAVNKANPLGHGGRVARAWAQLLAQLWSGAHGTVVPAALKQVLGEVSAQFRGTDQHDAQELLSFLLDGLHEDLNRVKVKPAVPVAESDGRPDEEVAR
jgi:ubiquitin C-terminal hydrolase